MHPVTPRQIADLGATLVAAGQLAETLAHKDRELAEREHRNAKLTADAAAIEKRIADAKQALTEAQLRAQDVEEAARKEAKAVIAAAQDDAKRIMREADAKADAEAKRATAAQKRAKDADAAVVAAENRLAQITAQAEAQEKRIAEAKAQALKALEA